MITKGKFSKPRTPQQEDRETEQAFRQASHTADSTEKLPRHGSSQEPDDFSEFSDEPVSDLVYPGSDALQDLNEDPYRDQESSSGDARYANNNPEEFSENPADDGYAAQDDESHYEDDSVNSGDDSENHSDPGLYTIPDEDLYDSLESGSAENIYDEDDSEDPEEPEAAASEVIRKNRRIAIGAISAACIVLVVCLSVGLWFLFRKPADSGLIHDNIFIAGINLGGKTPEEAAAALHAATDSTYTVTDMTVTTNRGKLVLSPDKTGAKLNVDQIVQAAYQCGRSGPKIPANGKNIEMLPYLNLNTDYIRSAVHSFIAKNSGTLTQPSVKENGKRPTLLPVPKDPDDTPQTLTITAGTPGLSIDEEAMYNAILDAYNANNFFGVKMDFTMMQPDPVDAKKIFSTYCLAPVDAALDPKTHEVTPEVWGYGVSMEELTKLLRDLDSKGSVEISMKYIKPAVTADQLNETLFRDTLASYDTEYNMYNTSRSKNLELAAAAINGTVLLPGETFSFNDVVGERTREKGYESAGAYTSEGSVDQVGGGVCQVASTIYYCSLMADLEIVDREEHMYVVSYVPMGMDATINWGTIDFAFRNNTKYPIRMETWAEDGEVHVALIGTDDKDYYVKMEYEIEETYDWKTVKKEFPADNAKGYKDGQSITDPHTGYDVKTYRVKYDKDTDEQISREYEATSNFEKQDEIIVVIKDQEETTEPTTAPTEPTETEPTVPETSEETKPTETEPTEAPETEPTETEPTETEPTETEPTETEAPETEAPETEPAETEAPETEAPETEASDPEVSESEDAAA